MRTRAASRYPYPMHAHARTFHPSLHPALRATFAAVLLLLTGCHAAPDALRSTVDAAVLPLMGEHRVPGMAVAVVHQGRTDLFTYGVASKETNRPVDEHTLFEIGSVSKTFTALLSADLIVRGSCSLDDPAAALWPALAGSAFDRITLRQLATYTAGGLPLQAPEVLRQCDDDTLIAFLRGWTPEYPPGERRLYSNISIGLFGRLAARSAGRPFADLMTRDLLPALGLTHTFLIVPAAEADRYALGYDKDDRPVRLTPGVFDHEAYGVKTDVADMARYVRAQLHPPADLARAVELTHTGLFSVGPMTQALGWELYPEPSPLEDLLAGASPDIVFQPNPVGPARAAAGPVLLNKTGSTNGFSAYVLMSPSKGLGVVLLANRGVPVPDRVRTAYAILRSLEP